jgi:hypothetical protein
MCTPGEKRQARSGEGGIERTEQEYKRRYDRNIREGDRYMRGGGGGAKDFPITVEDEAPLQARDVYDALHPIDVVAAGLCKMTTMAT